MVVPSGRSISLPITGMGCLPVCFPAINAAKPLLFPGDNDDDEDDDGGAEDVDGSGFFWFQPETSNHIAVVVGEVQLTAQTLDLD
eukprot:m.27400 g.27400  ORF g.27400 m.27400 type:complete len:85 (+) comp13941_c0_seq1:971-1225(+)